MRRGTARVSWLLALALLPAACAGGTSSAPPATPTPAAPAAAAAKPPDPAAPWLGHWLYQVQVGGEAYAGTMDVTRAADGSLQAKVVDNAMGEAPVSGVKLEGTTLTVNLLAGESPVSVVATLQPDGTATGKVLVNGGEGAFSAKKG